MLAQRQALTFSLGGLSKGLGLPQLKLGWMVAAGPEELVRPALERLEIICDTYLSVATPVQAGLPVLLADGAVIRRAIRDRVTRNYQALLLAAARCPSVDVLPAEGGWYAVIQVPAMQSEESLVLQLLEHDRVLVHPGYFFDFPREAYLVLSLLPPAEVFDRAVSRMLAPGRGGRVIVTPRAERARAAGLLLPLFSMPSTRSWGIGEFADLPVLARWMRGAGLGVLQVLPLNEMAPGQASRYSAVSAMALDPVFISVPDVPDFHELGGEDALDTAARGLLDHARASRAVDYWSVQDPEGPGAALRLPAVRPARLGGRFRAGGGAARLHRRAVLVARRLCALPGGAACHRRPPVDRVARGVPGSRRGRRSPRSRRESAQEILFRQYLQWIAHEQWLHARRESPGVRVAGDFPFGVAADSADVWANQHLFSFAGSVGAPPDAFSEDGQNWQLPAYRWDVMRGEGYAWFGAARPARVGPLRCASASITWWASSGRGSSRATAGRRTSILQTRRRRSPRARPC